MTISDANWNNSSDPFLMASAVTLSGFTDVSAVDGNGVFTFDVTGALNIIVDDPDVQEWFVVSDTVPVESTLALAFWLIDSEYDTGPASAVEYDGEAKNSFTVGFSKIFGAEASTEAVIYIANHSILGGLDNGYIGCRVAYCWKEKFAPQIIMSMAMHYSSWKITMRDYMDKASFQAASMDYDTYKTTGIGGGALSCWREAGSTLLEQIDKIVRQTVDWIAIRPDANGVVKLHYVGRHSGDERTTIIDFDDDSHGVKGYRGGVNNDLRIDKLNLRPGGFGRRQGNSSSEIRGATSRFESSYGHPLNTDANEDDVRFMRSTFNQSANISCPYWLTEHDLSRHFLMHYWAHEQEEISFEHGLQHFNYNIGDRVHISCAKLGLDGTEHFVVYEKDVDYDSLHAKVKVMRVYGYEGAPPSRFSQYDNCIAWFTPEQLGRQPQGLSDQVFESTSVWSPQNRREQRWMDQGIEPGRYLQQLTAGDPTLSIFPSEYGGALSYWPTLLAAPTSNEGLEAVGDHASNAEHTYIFVCKDNGGNDGINDEVLLKGESTVGVSTFTIWKHKASANATQYGLSAVTPQGSVQLLNDSDWHTIVIRSGGSLREDGVNVETGLTAHAHRLYNWTIFSDAGADVCNMQVVEVIMVRVDLSDAECAEIEEYLLEKYRHY